MKCDIIIPVYKSPEWVKLCVYAVCRNTEYINKVYLINDCDDVVTSNCLNNLANKYSCVEVLQNDSNLGFVKTCNRGMKVSTAKYVLLLNTDCIITSRTVGKLVSHMDKDNEIGLICPVASNAANLTLEMFDGFSYNDMDLLLEKKFKGKNFDACTVVGNCLMISRDCIEKTGYLDEIYGMGYGEETDYQFKAMKNGFKAKVAIDSYVFHKAEVSFGVSKEKEERQRKRQGKGEGGKSGEESREESEERKENARREPDRRRTGVMPVLLFIFYKNFVVYRFLSESSSRRRSLVSYSFFERST